MYFANYCSFGGEYLEFVDKNGKIYKGMNISNR